MKQVNSLYKTTALIALLTAIAFAAAAAMSPASLMPLAIGAAVWLLMAIGLYGGRRWIGYIAFIVAIASSLISFATLVPNQWVTVAMLGLSVIVALLLFVLIWKHPVVQTHSA